MSTTAATPASHPVLFSTSSPHVLPPSKYFIPNTFARFQLSQLINKVLDLPQPVPFDFLIRGQVLHGTIEEWCAERGVLEEETLEIEYFESLMPPKFLSSIGGEEWIGSVSCQLPSHILAGSFDSNIRVYNLSQKLLHTIPGHSGAVTSVCWVQRPNSSVQIASASHDATGRLWSFSEDEDRTPKALATLLLHTSPLSSIASNKSGSHILTASWDGLIGLFTSDIPDEDDVPELEVQEDRKKRRKVVSEDKPKRKAPVHVLKSHTARVSRAIFSQSDSSSAYSCGFDSTLRVWDLEKGICSGTVTLNEKPLMDLALTADGHTALAASTDRTVSIFDVRSAFVGQSGPAQTLLHPALPSALAAHPLDANKVMSGSYDGIVRIWDTRSLQTPMSTFEIRGKEGAGKKIMGVDWISGLLGVGGEGGLELWKVNDGGVPLTV